MCLFDVVVAGLKGTTRSTPMTGPVTMSAIRRYAAVGCPYIIRNRISFRIIESSRITPD